jgi:DNA-binding response OmpR family regulator
MTSLPHAAVSVLLTGILAFGAMPAQATGGGLPGQAPAPSPGQPALFAVVRLRGDLGRIYLVGAHFGQASWQCRLIVDGEEVPAWAFELRNDSLIVYRPPQEPRAASFTVLIGTQGSTLALDHGLPTSERPEDLLWPEPLELGLRRHNEAVITAFGLSAASAAAAAAMDDHEAWALPVEPGLDGSLLLNPVPFLTLPDLAALDPALPGSAQPQPFQPQLQVPSLPHQPQTDAWLNAQGGFSFHPAPLPVPARVILAQPQAALGSQAGVPYGSGFAPQPSLPPLGKTLIKINGVQVWLPYEEKALLDLLAMRPGMTVTYGKIAERIWPGLQGNHREWIKAVAGNLEPALREPGEPSPLHHLPGIGYALSMNRNDHSLLGPPLEALVLPPQPYLQAVAVPPPPVPVLPPPAPAPLPPPPPAKPQRQRPAMASTSSKKKVMVGGNWHYLAPSPYLAFKALEAAAGQVVSIDRLITAVYGDQPKVNAHKSVTNLMCALRSKIEKANEPKRLTYSFTAGSEGYRLDLSKRRKERARKPAAAAVAATLDEDARHFGDLDFNPVTGALLVRRQPMGSLTLRQGRLLLALMDRGGAEVSRKDLLRAVWGDETEQLGASTLASLVMAVRAKLGETPGRPAYLHRGAGNGYLLTQAGQ